MSNSELAILIQRLGAALERLSSDDVKLLLANKASLTITVTRAEDSTKRIVEKPNEAVTFDVAQIARGLEASSTRQEGAALLKDMSKLQLQALARHFSVSVDSSANKQRLIEIIVERKVGLRLRQSAFTQVMTPV